jgi:hypothetical protein
MRLTVTTKDFEVENRCARIPRAHCGFAEIGGVIAEFLRRLKSTSHRLINLRNDTKAFGVSTTS